MGFFASLATAILDPSKENVGLLKGAKGEAQAISGMFLFLPPEYMVMHDILLPIPSGTTQIDHVVISNYGIFVIESKNISGAIYGSANDKNWTVCLGPKKYSLYNPLLQNAGHIKALVATTNLPESLFHSLVFFWSDNCKFKTPMPENVRQMGLCSYIRSKRKFLMPAEDVRNAIRLIETKRIPSTTKNLTAHVANLKSRFPMAEGH